MKNILQNLGLTEGETKVYLALNKIGTSKTGILAKESGVSSSKVYKILDRLEKKGIVGHVIKGEIKHYSALEPKQLLQLIKEKEKEIEEQKKQVLDLIPQLELAQQEAEEKTEATLFQGFKAIQNFFMNILNDLEKGEEYFVLGALYGEVSRSRQFFKKYHSLRAKEGITVNMLINHNVNIIPETRPLGKIRYLPKYLSNKTTMIFYKDKMLITVMSKEPVGFLLKNEDVVKSFKAYFKTLWKISK